MRNSTDEVPLKQPHAAESSLDVWFLLTGNQALSDDWVSIKFALRLNENKIIERDERIAELEAELKALAKAKRKTAKRSK